jgi:hypothetical protein
MVPGEEPGAVREKRAAVYASERVQKASRTYIGGYLSQRLCHEFTPELKKVYRSIGFQEQLSILQMDRAAAFEATPV